MERYMNANIVFSKFSRDYMELKKDLPIRPSEMAVVNIITKRDGDFTPLAIAELLGVSKPMIAAHIAVLEKKGYIYKESSMLDKRSFYVRPTDKAKALADEFEASQTENLKKIEMGLGEESFAELIRLLEKTQTVLDEMKG
ncbi:MAG: winged helix-turn-helix transcriptional regulator [Oscillospiraceae bacterium]|nr:winged helix-turn-helix transcriptional regulator [Oscillospiraceae bacterium]